MGNETPNYIKEGKYGPEIGDDTDELSLDDQLHMLEIIDKINGQNNGEIDYPGLNNTINTLKSENGEKISKNFTILNDMIRNSSAAEQFNKDNKSTINTMKNRGGYLGMSDKNNRDIIAKNR